MGGEETLYDRAKKTAFRLLSVRARSVMELQSRLKDKGFPDPVVAGVIERLRELQYLDDVSFARQWARNLAVNKLWGNRKIIGSLKEKGISPMLIEKIIPEVRGEITEEEAIKQLIQKKGKDTHCGRNNIKEKLRLSRNLVARGFPPDIVFQMLRTSKEECIDEGE